VKAVKSLSWLLAPWLVFCSLPLSSCLEQDQYQNSDVAPLSERQLQAVVELVTGGDLAAAEAQLVELCSRHPDSVEAHRQLQDLRRERLSAAELERLYTDELQRQPTRAMSHYLAGRAVIDRADEARERFEQALRLEPMNPWPSVALAYLARSEGDYFAAVSVYRQALESAPRSARLRWFLGSLYLDLGLLVDAQRELQLALRLDPSNVRPLTALGRVHHALGRKELAYQTLRRSLHQLPEQSAGYEPLTRLYLEWRCSDKAMAAYRRGLELGTEPDPALEGQLRALQLVDQEGAAQCKAPSWSAGVAGS
tara:strand:+ start:1370 stop:2299 length:930 start_codon:yes stop_codon:yes gene_type:complete